MADEILSYNTIMKDACGEIVEKKSRFIANIYHVESEEEALKHVEALKKEHYQSRHVCYAYVLGEKGDNIRYSDDGEPSGTAGRPMLDILKGKNLTYVVACVTRYFGGVLLGTGGLVRAYSDSLTEGLQNAQIIKMELRKSISLTVEYQDIGRLDHSLPGLDAVITDRQFSDKVGVTISVASERESDLVAFLTEMTGGKAQIEDKGFDYVPVE